MPDDWAIGGALMMNGSPKAFREALERVPDRDPPIRSTSVGCPKTRFPRTSFCKVLQGPRGVTDRDVQ
jgi:hypothetical protein